VTGQLRAELLKLRTTRTAIGLVLVQVGLMLLALLVEGLASKPQRLAELSTQRDYFGSASIAGLIAAFLGLLAVTGEFRFGTIRPTLVAEPRRRVVVAAKLAASAAGGVALAVLGLTLAFGVGWAVFAGRGVDVVLGGRHTATIALGTLTATLLWGVLGAGVGAIVRHQVGAIVTLIAWSFVLESILFSFVPSVGRFLPGEASSALVDGTDAHLLSPGVGGAVFLAWVAAIAAAAVVRTERSDVA
jgi:ABC-2 type transport system permease protein